MNMLKLHLAKSPTYDYSWTEFYEMDDKNVVVINPVYIQGICRWENDKELPMAKTYIRFSNGDVIFIMESYEDVVNALTYPNKPAQI